MHILFMNPMRGPAEHRIPVARSEDPQELLSFVAGEKVKPYREEREEGRTWLKCFRKGGPLEWYNDLSEPNGALDGYGVGIQDVGDEDEWIERAREEWRAMHEVVPTVKAAKEAR